MARPDEEPDADDETPLEQTVAGGVMALVFLVGFGLMFAGVPYFWVVFPVGFAGVLPMAVGLVKYYQRQQDGSDTAENETEDALEALRRRYARGELTDEEFERRVAHLLETESVADARAFAERADTSQNSERRQPERERR